MPRPFRPLAALAAAALPLVFAPHPAAAQIYGGSGFEGEVVYGPPVQYAPSRPSTGERFSYGSGSAGVLISPDKSQVWGFSKATGKLVPLDADIEESMRDRLNPLVGGDVVAMKLGDAVHAFSGETGTWGTHELGDDAEEASPTVSSGLAYVATKSGFAVFTAQSGEWTSVEYDAAKPDAEPAYEDDAVITDEIDVTEERMDEVRDEAAEVIEEFGGIAEEVEEVVAPPEGGGEGPAMKEEVVDELEEAVEEAPTADALADELDAAIDAGEPGPPPADQPAEPQPESPTDN